MALNLIYGHKNNTVFEICRPNFICFKIVPIYLTPHSFFFFQISSLILLFSYIKERDFYFLHLLVFLKQKSKCCTPPNLNLIPLDVHYTGPRKLEPLYFWFQRFQNFKFFLLLHKYVKKRKLYSGRQFKERWLSFTEQQNRQCQSVSSSQVSSDKSLKISWVELIRT